MKERWKVTRLGSRFSRYRWSRHYFPHERTFQSAANLGLEKSFMRCLSLALVTAVFAIAGCLSAPPPQPQYAETAHKVQLASASYELQTPATLPIEDVLDGPHPVEVYVQIALERNPEVLAAQQRVSAEAQVIPQVTALDDPMLSDTFWPINDHALQTAAGRIPNTLSVSQKFPWLGKLRVRGEIAEQETKIALTQLAEAQLKVIEDVHLAYYEIYYNQQAISITEESEELLQQLVRFAEVRFRTGGSQQDVLRAQLELDRLRDRLITLGRELRLSQADLAAILHTSPDTEPGAEESLVMPQTPEVIDRLYESAVKCRPELQGRLHAIVRDERKRELAALEYYPDVRAGIGWSAVTREDALAGNANGNDNINFMVEINIPLWRDKLRAGVREAEHRTLESARRYDATRDDTFRQIRRQIAQIDAFERQITLFRESIIPRAEQTLNVSIADYRVGKVDFLQIIDNWTELLVLQTQLARLQANLGQSLASLERAVGCQLASLPDAPEALEPEPEPAENDDAPKQEPANENP